MWMKILGALMLAIFLLDLKSFRRDWQGSWRAKTDYAVSQLYRLVGGLGFLVDNFALVGVATILFAVWWSVGRHVYVEKTG